jgi:chromate transporter
MTGSDEAEARPPHLSLIGLFVRFLRFGALAFGGPVAQIAMIHRELVEEERWIDGARFNRLLAVMQALPGPEAHELCVHMGIRARGRLGGLLAGLGFMLPGLIVMLLAAWAYSVWAERVALLSAVFAGVQATVLAVIVRAVHRIGEHILTAASLWIIAVLAAAATAAGGTFWIVLIAAGLVQVAVVARRWALAVGVVSLAAGLFWLTRGPASVADLGEPVTATATPLGLFIAGLKGGLLTFGGAYTAIPFVRQDTVGQGLASDQQFLDGVGLANALPRRL